MWHNWYESWFAEAACVRGMQMFKKIKSWQSLASDRRGVTALEYALIAGIIIVVIAVGFGVYAGDLSTQFGIIGTGI